MPKADHYSALGVERNATADEIRSAYRKLARQHHPDVSTSTDGSARFKEITEAYAVLSDPEKKQQYDQFGDTAFHQRFSQEDIFRNADLGDIFREFGFGGGDDVFSQIFGRGATGARRQPRPVKGSDYLMRITIPFRQAILGGERRIDFDRNGQNEHLQVRIPPGVEPGQKLRISGKGGASPSGGPSGDLMIEINITDDPRFRREGKDLYTTVAIPFSGACLGTSVLVQTLEDTKRIKVKPGTQNGSKIRLKGFGVPGRAGQPAGDLYVVIEVQVPLDLSDEQKELLKTLQESGL